MSNIKENIIHMSLDKIMSDRFGRYAKYIIQGRALPDARDGLNLFKDVFYSLCQSWD